MGATFFTPVPHLPRGRETPGRQEVPNVPPGEDLRHHPSRRYAGGGSRLLDGGQGPAGPAAGRPRRPLHRGRLARLQPEGHALLSPDPGRAAQARPGRRLRRHPAGGHQGRRRPEPAGARRSADAGRHHLRQVVALPRHARAGHHAAREPRDDRRLGGLPGPARRGGRLRRRALLRRLQARPRVRAADAGGGRGRRRPVPGAVRHQRREPAARGRGDRARGAPARPDPPGDPRPQRRGVRGGQLPGGRARGGRAGAGDGQRLRRAVRQREPDLHHPQPRAQAGDPGHPRPRTARAAGSRALRLRAGQPHAVAAPAVRRATPPSPTRPACTSRRS